MDDLEAVRQISEVLSQIPDKEVQERVIRWSLEKAGIDLAGATMDAPGGIPTPAPVSGIERQKGATDIKSFITEKNPSSDNQFAAAVAYYYAFEAPTSERRGVVTPSDLNDACRMVGRRRLGDPAKTLANATSMGYLDKVERGVFKINTVGENLVAITLPGSVRDSNGMSSRRAPSAKKGQSGQPRKSSKKTGAGRKR